MQGSGAKTYVIDPVNQRRDSLYTLRGCVFADPRWPRQYQRWTYMLVFPHASILGDFALPDIQRNRIADRDQLDQLAMIAHRLAQDTGQQDRPFLSVRAVGRFAEVLGVGGSPAGCGGPGWVEELPTLMSELADELPNGRTFDAVIMDEAQDCTDN